MILENKENSITLDTTDFPAMRKLMKEHGDSNFPFFGTNEEGEAIAVSIEPDNIVIETEQENGRVRKNAYWNDGTCEEWFCGTWKDSAYQTINERIREAMKEERQIHRK